MPSTFTLGSASLTGAPDPNTLFPGNVVLQYTDQANNAVVLQAVHLGTQQLTITPNDTTISPVTVALSVEEPKALGTPINDPRLLKEIPDLDSVLDQLADDTGIPPQMIKGQVKTEGRFDPMAWRYEPLNAEVGDFAYSNNPKDLRTVSHYGSSLRLPTIGDRVDPGNCGDGYDYTTHVDSRIPDRNCTGLTQGATFSQQVMSDISHTYYTIMIPKRDPLTGVELTGNNGQPILRALDPTDRYVSARDILISNDGTYHWSSPKHVPSKAARDRLAQLENGAVDFSAQPQPRFKLRTAPGDVCYSD